MLDALWFGFLGGSMYSAIGLANAMLKGGGFSFDYRKTLRTVLLSSSLSSVAGVAMGYDGTSAGEWTRLLECGFGAVIVDTIAKTVPVLRFRP